MKYYSIKVKLKYFCLFFCNGAFIICNVLYHFIFSMLIVVPVCIFPDLSDTPPIVFDKQILQGFNFFPVEDSMGNCGAVYERLLHKIFHCYSTFLSLSFNKCFGCVNFLSLLNIIFKCGPI